MLFFFFTDLMAVPIYTYSLFSLPCTIFKTLNGTLIAILSSWIFFFFLLKSFFTASNHPQDSLVGVYYVYRPAHSSNPNHENAGDHIFGGLGFLLRTGQSTPSYLPVWCHPSAPPCCHFKICLHFLTYKLLNFKLEGQLVFYTLSDVDVECYVWL